MTSCYDMEDNKTSNVLKSSTSRNNVYFFRGSFKSTDDIFKKYDYYANRNTPWRTYVCSYSTPDVIKEEITNESKNDGNLF